MSQNSSNVWRTVNSIISLSWLATYSSSIIILYKNSGETSGNWATIFSAWIPEPNFFIKTKSVILFDLKKK